MNVNDSASASTSDILALQDLVSLYGHLMDAKEFHQLGRVFTSDATFDASSFGVKTCRDLADLQAMMATETRHPVAHHATNVLVELQDPLHARIRSKGLAVSRRGTVTSLVYDDRAVRTADGWRIASRTAVPLPR